MILSDLIRAVADVFYKKVPVPATAGVTKTATGEFDPWAYDTNGNCYIDVDEVKLAFLDWFNKVITDAQYGMMQVLYWDHIENPGCVHEIHGLHIVFWNIAYFFGGLGWDTLTSWFNDVAWYCKDISDNLNSAADTLDTWWDTISQTVSDISALFTDIDDVITWVKGVPTEIATYVTNAIDAIDVPGADDVIAWVFTKLGIAKGADESWWHALWSNLWAEFIDPITALLPDADDVIAWVFTKLGVTKGADESWWHALWSNLWNGFEDLVKALIPDADDVIDWVLTKLGIELEPGETTWEALLRTIIGGIPYLSEIITFWQDLGASIYEFFNAPWDWLEAKFTDWFLGPEK